MFCTFSTLLMMMCGIGVLVCIACQRISAHAQQNPEVRKIIAEHIILPILSGPPKDESEKEQDSPQSGKKAP